MQLTDFLKPNAEKLLIMLFSYTIFYLFDVAVLSPAEVFYLPGIAQQFLSAPGIYWILRLNLN